MCTLEMAAILLHQISTLLEEADWSSTFVITTTSPHFITQSLLQLNYHLHPLSIESRVVSRARTMTDLLDVPHQVSASSLSLLILEIVPTSIRVSYKLQLTKFNESNSLTQTRIDTPLLSIEGDLAGTVNVLNSELIDEDDVTVRIEEYGFTLGVRLSEVLMYKSSTGGAGANAKIVDVLDIMKFVCRDVWKCLYNKQMDNLRTNHRGTFVLVDNNYRLIANFNSPEGMAYTLRKAKTYLWFPCGVIRGILSNFGVEATVTAEITQFPSVTFNIHTPINN